LGLAVASSATPGRDRNITERRLAQGASAFKTWWTMSVQTTPPTTPNWITIATVAGVIVALLPFLFGVDVVGRLRSSKGAPGPAPTPSEAEQRAGGPSPGANDAPRPLLQKTATPADSTHDSSAPEAPRPTVAADVHMHDVHLEPPRVALIKPHVGESMPETKKIPSKPPATSTVPSVGPELRPPHTLITVGQAHWSSMPGHAE
jgi:hypothetical protein